MRPEDRAPGPARLRLRRAYRNEDAVGDIKQIWELSRHQHLTVLAAAYAVTGDERYAERVAEHLRSWWAANPPLRGVHWISGIELGIRLLSWVWIRRLLDGWPGAAGLFEGNPVALHQIWHHQRWLAAFPSRGSSANNHVIAEAAGQFAAACAFGWFPASARWRADALRSLERQLRGNTFPSGLNRELATEYHGLVAGARPGRGGRGGRRRRAGPRVGPAGAAADDRRARGHRGQPAAAAAPGGRGRRARAGRGRRGHRPLGLAPGHRGRRVRPARLVAGGAGTDVRTPLLAALIRPCPHAQHRP